MATKRAAATTAKDLVVTNPFMAAALAEVEKTEKDVVREKVTNFLETATIECEMQIASRSTGEIPTKELQLRTANVNLAKAKKTLVTVSAQIPTDGKLETYLKALYSAENAVKVAETVVDSIHEEIKVLNKEVVKFEEVLARFKA